jgi:hypothetical protein
VIRHAKTPVWSGFCRFLGLTGDFSVVFLVGQAEFMGRVGAVT